MQNSEHILSKHLTHLGFVLVLAILTQPAIACRLWAVIANEGYYLYSESPESNALIFSQLSDFQVQGQSYPDGWSLMYYGGSSINHDVSIVRSALPVNENPSLYDSTINTIMLSENESYQAIGHLRAGTSGAIGIPNPHPFVIQFGGNTYSLVHNGTLSKEILLSLLTEEGVDTLWLSNHAPNTYGNGHWSSEGWDSVVDSELYFLWIMKNIEASGSLLGLTQALTTLNQVIPGTEEKTIIFSDGSSLFLFGAENTLHYTDGSTPPSDPYSDVFLHHKAVMTVPPTVGMASYLTWLPIEDNQIVELSGASVNITNILGTGDISILPLSISLKQNYPNPFNPSTSITYDLSQETNVRLVIYNLTGRAIAVLQSGIQQPGIKTLEWNAGSLAGGLYIYSLETQFIRVSKKMILLK